MSTLNIKDPKEIELLDTINDSQDHILTVAGKLVDDSPYSMWDSKMTMYKITTSTTIYDAQSPEESPSNLVYLTENDISTNNDFDGLTIMGMTAGMTKPNNNYQYLLNGKNSEFEVTFTVKGADNLVDKVIWIKFECNKRNGAPIDAKWCKVTFKDLNGGLIDVNFTWS